MVLGSFSASRTHRETPCPVGLQENAPITDQNCLLNRFLCLGLKSKK